MYTVCEHKLSVSIGGSCKGNKCAFIHDLGRLSYDHIVVRLMVLDVYNHDGTHND